ncbi:MAG: NADP-specific glutamate dehydrogenase [Tissierellia bacterium]|nr:NADP-specific glutamate dehydrogenase [Tissierellia bacterium]
MTYLQKIIDDVKLKDPDQPEFHQTAEEILSTIEPVLNNNSIYVKSKVIERLVEPERQIIFRVPWVDKNGELQINRGFRVQHSSAIGPYKGGLRFHPSVNLGIIKFLAFEQTFKNALTGLSIGGGKGGSDFNPRGKSDLEIMNFCQSFMTELYRHIGQFIDIPAGDMGVGEREIGYLYGQYKRISNTFEAGTLTGKGISYGGSLARKEATGYGVLYFVNSMINYHGHSLTGKKVIISGSGNVALYSCKKAVELGAKVIAMSDSDGYIYDENGIDFKTMHNIKEIQRKRISEYVNYFPKATYTKGRGIWNIKCDIAFPCATQNDIDVNDAQALIDNGCFAVGEGANMPTTNAAIKLLLDNNILLAPAKAANAGGVATSALEMAQNSARLSWTFEEVDSKLKEIMKHIFEISKNAAEDNGMHGNYVAGANIAAFTRVADAMISYGSV